MSRVSGLRRSGKRGSKFFGCDSATNRNAPKQSIAVRICRKDDRLSKAKEAYFKALRAEVPELTKIATGKGRGL